jgi:hypothetical protein
MRQLLITAFEDAVTQTKADLKLMPLTRWNESVFRFLYSRAVTTRAPDVTQFFECNKIDLVLHRKSEGAFIEFKFYIHSPAYDALTGKKIDMKSFASPQNFREFKNSVGILRQRPAPPEILKLVALFYSDPCDPRRKTYNACYGDSSGVERELNICRLISIGPFSPEGSDTICSARLYEVGI